MIGKVIDVTMKAATLVVAVVVMIKLMFFSGGTVAYPDYTELLKSIETQLNSKLDSLGVDMKGMRLRLEENKKKVISITEKREDIKDAKQDVLESIDIIPIGDDKLDSIREKLFKHR